MQMELQTELTSIRLLWGAVWSGSALFAQTCLSENLGSLQYTVCHSFEPITPLQNHIDQKLG